MKVAGTSDPDLEPPHVGYRGSDPYREAHPGRIHRGRNPILCIGRVDGGGYELDPSRLVLAVQLREDPHFFAAR